MKIVLQNGYYIKKISISILILSFISFCDINIAPYCKIRSIPYCGFSLSTLVDGIYDVKEPGEAEFNIPQFNKMGNSLMNFGVEVYFTFPEMYKLKKVRIFKKNPDINYILNFYLVNGEKTEKLETNQTGWIEYITEEPFDCKEIKIKSYGGNETVYLGIEEIEIIVEDKIEKKKIDFAPLRVKKREEIEEVILRNDNIKKSLYVLGPSVYSFPELWAEKISKLGANTIILYGHFYGNINELENGKYTLPGDYEIRRYLERGIKFLKEEGKQTILIASWPSKVVPGTKENYLKKTIEAFHKYNIKVIVSVGFFIPFDTFKHYPRCGQSDRHLLPATHCIISDNFISDLGSSLYKEIIKNGADGVVLGGDEFGAEGHRLSAISPYDPCIEKFKKKYGYKTLPVDAEDNLRYRRWKLFEYEGIGNLFKKWNNSIKSLKKDVISTCLLLPWPLCFSDRMWSGLAYDIIGHISGMDYLTTDYYRPFTTIKLISSASPKRKGGYTWTIGYFQPEYLPFKDEIFIYGPVLAILGQSGKELSEIALYEHRHIIFSKGGKPESHLERDRGYNVVKKLFNLIRYLEKEGINEAETPKEILLLYSRSSEDWWQLKNNYKESFSPTIMRNRFGPDWKKILFSKTTEETNKIYLKQIEGYIWHQGIMDLFTSRGYPYDIYYIDQTKTLPKLDKYKVIIIPFGYSLSKEASEKIKKAVESGVGLILLNFKGEVDEFGEVYKVPVFQDIIDKENVYFLKFDINEKSEEGLANEILPIIDKYVKDRIPKMKILNDENLYGKLFFFTLKKQNKYFLTLVNFGNISGKLQIDFPNSVKKLKGLTLDEIIEFETENKKNIQIEIPEKKGMVLICEE
jgi:hypothetical protein